MCEGAPLADGSGFAAGRYVFTGRDSELVRRFKAAGLVSARQDQYFGVRPVADHRAGDGSARPAIPWDHQLGARAAPAAGPLRPWPPAWSPAGHASDRGGSIRIPASCCGLVGLKPTRGRNSLAPGIGDIAGGIIHEHVVTRSVRDSAAILDATSGPMAGDPYFPASPQRPFLEETRESAWREAGRLRIGLGTESLNARPRILTVSRLPNLQLCCVKNWVTMLSMLHPR